MKFKKHSANPVQSQSQHPEKKLPRVFAGTDHFLILKPNGDLYAIGNNRNGCCGEDQKAELMCFTRIAENVAHAAAGKNHTLYVDRSGKVTILGRSDYAERFQCDFPVTHVYVHTSYDVFLLEDENGTYHFFGNRGQLDCVTSEIKHLRRLPRVSMQIKEENTWGYHHLEYHSWCSQYKQERTVLSGSLDYRKVPQLQDAMRSDWYRALVQEYGDGNVIIRMGESVEKKVISSRTIPNGTDHRDYETVEEFFYEPEVLYINNRIFKPMPCTKTEMILPGNRFIGCWPENSVYFNPKEEEYAKCFHYFPDNRSGIYYVLLDDTGKLSFGAEYEEYDPKACLTEIADLAVSPFQCNAFCKDLILVVTRSGDVYYGLRDELEHAARKRSKLEKLLKKTDLWSHMTKVDFSVI